MNALTVDVEDYYQTNGLDIPAERWKSYEQRVEQNTRRLLDCFERHEAKGTFFIVGYIARMHPSLVKEIAERGHEIGSHSIMHKLLTKMNAAAFREDARISKQLLEDLIGRQVNLYRAPSWSLGESSYEWLGILQEEGYRIDSSIQPFSTPLSGAAGAPTAPFRPIVNGKRLSIIEFPSTVWHWGPLRIPFAGGLYLRAMPLSLIDKLLRAVNRTRTGMVYIHPWELDPLQPRLPTSPLIRFAQYYKLSATEKKIDRLLEQFTFQPLGKVVDTLLKQLDIPDVVLK